jgi:hypothetical protein
MLSRQVFYHLRHYAIPQEGGILGCGKTTIILEIEGTHHSWRRGVTLKKC